MRVSFDFISQFRNGTVVSICSIYTQISTVQLDYALLTINNYLNCFLMQYTECKKMFMAKKIDRF